MKKGKKILAAILAAAMLPVFQPAPHMQVQANTSAMSPSYNTNVNYIAYATEVEDQAQTNYCWAYMTDAVLESYLMKTQAGVQADFSEWDMITQLSNGSYAFSDLYSGGNYHQAVAYWTRGSMYGPRLEANSSLTDYYVSETAELGRYDRTMVQSKLNYIQNIKNLVVNYGAVGVSVYFTAEDRAMTTRDGAYFYPEQVSPGVNHGVTIVGWDDDYAPQWFYNSLTTPHQPQNKGAFLVKNSWGRDGSSIGGNSGYYWISYDNYFQDAFGVTQVLDRSKLYDRVYETDYRGLYDFWSGTSYSQTYDLSGGAQWLTGIATYVRGGASYQFFLDGKELPGCGGTAAQSGYHTFQLATPVLVSGRMELRAEVTGNQEAVPVACSANSHEADGGNVCLKAFTKFQYSNAFGGSSGQVWNPSTPAYTVTGVTLAPQDCSVMQGTNRLFTAKVLGNGQSSVSQRINWQISGSSSPNTRISADGNLYVGADETSEVLYIYANSYVDSTQGASARVEVIKSGTSGSQTGANNTNTWTTGTGTNINGTPITPPVTGTTGGTSAGTPTTGTVITGTPITPQEPSEDQSGDPTLEDNAPVQVGTVDKGIYSVWKNGTAQYTKCTSPNHISINIPATVKIGGETYEVNILDDGCIRNQKKVRSITIGKNVTQIGDESFYGCKQLKKVKILSEQIEYIGEDAFRGISAKAVVYVPRSCLAEYREMVRDSGNGTVRVKAYN